MSNNDIIPRIIFAIDCINEMAITVLPNAMQAYAAYVSQVLRLVSFTKQSGGRIYARAQALVAPTNSKTMPRSHVKSDRVMAEMTKDVVKIK